MEKLASRSNHMRIWQWDMEMASMMFFFRSGFHDVCACGICIISEYCICPRPSDNLIWCPSLLICRLTCAFLCYMSFLNWHKKHRCLLSLSNVTSCLQFVSDDVRVPPRYTGQDILRLMNLDKFHKEFLLLKFPIKYCTNLAVKC